MFDEDRDKNARESRSAPPAEGERRAISGIYPSLSSRPSYPEPETEEFGRLNPETGDVERLEILFLSERLKRSWNTGAMPRTRSAADRVDMPAARN